MTTGSSHVLLHPVRLRIAIAATGGEMTTTDFATELPDIPQATLYRHVAALAESGILEVVSERHIRGAVERTYRLNSGKAVLGPDAARSMSKTEHLQALTTYAGVLIDTYGRYLASPEADPASDGVSFRQTRVWLNDDELESMVGDIRSVLSKYLDLEATEERSPRLLATILMPDGELRSH